MTMTSKAKWLRRLGWSILALLTTVLLLAVGAPEPVSPPANPGEFDYRAFLANRQIHFRKFLNHKDYTIAGQQPLNYLLAHAQKLREHFRAVLQKHIPGRDENSVALALVLGIKDQLGRQLQATYAGAGAMHVLAVSGLHVGIIFMLFQFLLQAFGKRAASSPAARLLVILVLFAYAFITGLSASVVRAATMFSLMQLGGMLGRKGNTHNTVAFSAFLLLCWNPFYLFEVGFQLSYLAVFGIVYLQPKIALLWQPAGRARIFLRDLLSVSVAAQIATFPLGLLYFNQFPVYFLLSNLVVINAAGLLLLSCIVLLGLSFIPVVPAIALAGLGKVIAWCIWLQNMLLQVIVELPGAVASDIYITPPEAWLIYATILALAALFATRRFYWLTTTFILVLLLVATGLHRQWQQQQQTELVIYSTGGQVAIGLLKGQAALLLAEGNLLQDQQKLDYHIAPHLLQRGIKHLTKQPVEHAGQAGIIGRCTPAGNLLLRFRDKNLLVLTEKNTDPALRLADYVVLAKAVNLAASTAHLGNTQIVLASNSRYQQRKLSTLLQDSNTNVQAVQLQQALVLNW